MDVGIKKRSIHRAKILEGQMEGLTKAIEAEKYCVDLLLQSLSIQQSLKSLSGLLLENHIRTHVKHQLRDAKQENKAVAELLKIFTLSNRS
jgi:DNA-binding FrmR family transcriptional regulator